MQVTHSVPVTRPGSAYYVTLLPRSAPHWLHPFCDFSSEALLDDVPICPPWWPIIIWWHIHNPPGPGPDPGPIDRQLVAKLDAHFAAVAITALSNRLGDRKIAEQVGINVGRLASNPMPGLGGHT